MSTRKIIHVDMDCFYAAVEMKYRPELRGKAIGIGGPANSRSVLCTASYEARKYGVRSAMPSAHAARLCPHILLIRPNFDLYKKESVAVRQIFSRFSDNIEPLSLDEAYLDVTNSPHCGGSATLMAREIRRLIASELSLPASAGIAPNKFLAKIASDWKKPNGQFLIRPEDIDAFMPTLPIEKIHGVGKVTAEYMHKLGLRTCGDIQEKSVAWLKEHFGSRGESLARQCRGIDSRPVDAHWERKSLSVEETFHEDIRSAEDCLDVFPELYREWERRMAKGKYGDRIRGAVVKVKFFDFKHTTHEISVRKYPSRQQFEELFLRIWEKRSEPVRLLGLGVRLASEEATVSPQLRFDF